MEVEMGFLDNAKKQLKGAVDKHGDTIAKGLDRAAAEADKRTGGKHSDKIAKARSAAKDGLDKLDGKKDDLPPDNPPRTYPRADEKP
jgi:hypothetical protein